MTTPSIYRSLGPNTGSIDFTKAMYNPMDELSFLTEPSATPNWQAQYAPTPISMGNDRVLPPTGVMDTIGNWFKENPALSTKDQQGWGNLALGTAQAGMGAYLGMKQYGLAKKAFEHQKDAWNKEYEVNKNLTNERLETRQNRRIAESGVTGMQHQDTASFMSRYGVK